MEAWMFGFLAFLGVVVSLQTVFVKSERVKKWIDRLIVSMGVLAQLAAAVLRENPTNWEGVWLAAPIIVSMVLPSLLGHNLALKKGLAVGLSILFVCSFGYEAVLRMQGIDFGLDSASFAATWVTYITFGSFMAAFILWVHYAVGRGELIAEKAEEGSETAI